MKRRPYKNQYYKHHSGFQKRKKTYHNFINTLGTFSFNNGIYRSDNGVFLGVCSGISEYFDLNVFWMRFIILILFIFTGFWPVGFMYIFAGLLMRKKSTLCFTNGNDADFYDNHYSSREPSINKMKKKFDDLNGRIQAMEDRVTSREFMI